MNHQIDLENIIRTVMKEDGLQTPSNDFTDKVMHTITNTEVKPAPYRPLIPKYVLAVIFSGVVLLILFLLSGVSAPTGKNPLFLDKVLNDFRIFDLHLVIPAQISYIITSALILLVIQAALLGTIYKKTHT